MMRLETASPDNDFVPLTQRERFQDELSEYRRVLIRLLKTAFPLIGINLAITLEGFSTGVILGKITEESLAAGSLIGSSNLILSTSIMAPLYASNILIRECKGSRQSREIALIWRQSLIIGTALSTLRILLMKLALKPVLNTITDRPDIVDLVQQYYDFYIFGILFDAFSQVYENFFLGIDKIPLVLCVRYSRLLIFVLTAFMLSQNEYGGAGLGVSGISIAFGIQALLSLSIYATLAACKEEFAEYELLKNIFVGNTKHLKRLWSTGWPIGLLNLNSMSSEFVITIMTAKFPDPALAAREISGIYNSLLYQPTDAISLGTCLLVSESIGEGRAEDVARFGNMGIIMGLISALVGIGLFSVFPTQLTAFFIDSENPDNYDVYELMKIMLLIIAFSQLAESTATICYRALAGLQDTLVPTILATSVTWFCGIPLAYCISNDTPLGFKGLLIGQGGGMLLTSLILCLRWIKKSSDTKKLLSSRFKKVEDTATELMPLLARTDANSSTNSNHSIRLFHPLKMPPIPNYSATCQTSIRHSSALDP